MSDVAIAPAPAAPQPAAPSPPPPSSNEVVINQNPTQTPQPIGSQAPPIAREDGRQRPNAAEDNKPPPSRRDATRDAIKKAFARTSEPGAAKPAIGHNKPPVETPKEGALDLKKRPSEQGTGMPSRGEHGHFAPRQQDAPGQQPGQQPGQPGQQQRANVVQLPQHAPYRDAPQRMSGRAKQEWANAPESVRGEVHRMHKEFSQAYQRMHGESQEFNRIRHFHDLARSHGTTLDKALHNYVSMEDKLRTDPIAGLDVIINNLNLRTPDGQRIGFRDIAWHVLNQSPEQHKSLQLQNSQTALTHQLGQLHQQQRAIAQSMQQLQYERAFTHKRSEVDRFAETHPRLDELGKAIEQELNLGFDLDTAYARADRLYPATHAAQTRTHTAQTRTHDRSISGAPDGGPLNGSGQHNGKPPGRRESIVAAMKTARGSL